jgi:hypothetical protein
LLHLFLHGLSWVHGATGYEAIETANIMEEEGFAIED